MRLNSKVGGVVAVILCVIGYQLLRYQLGKPAAYIFAVIVLTGGLAMQIIYRRRIGRLRDTVAAMSEEDRRRFLHEIDPESAGELERTFEHEKSDI